jgi:hypothetical protein
MQDCWNLKRGVGAVILGLILASPAFASILPVGNSEIDQIIEGVIKDETGGSEYLNQAKQYWEEISGYYQDIVSGNLESILPNLPTSGGINPFPQPETGKPIGAMGIPDIQKHRSDTLAQAESPIAVVEANNRAEMVERALAISISQMVFSEEGQALIRSQQEATTANFGQAEGAFKETQAIANAAQSKQITQDVMKDLVKQSVTQSVIELKQTAISREMSQQLSGLQMQGAANNLMLSDVSRTLAAGESRAQQEEQTQALASSAISAQIFIPGVPLTSTQ